MAARDKSLTVLGSEAVVVRVQLLPQPDGSLAVIVAGGAKDDSGQVVGLAEARGRLDPKDPAVAPLFELALVALRQANGLDDAPQAVLQPLELPGAA